ncbi:MAG: hypothetical protein NVV73_10065 [Cellvibrionaceae bacterium]|nr:hypothetical protein [Cellvibrionaceae bacterium]
MSFEKHGIYEVDRAAVEELIGGQMAESLRKDVEAGKLSQCEATQINNAFLKSDAFKQAVDATIGKVVSQLALEDFKAGLREGLRAE